MVAAVVVAVLAAVVVAPAVVTVERGRGRRRPAAAGGQQSAKAAADGDGRAREPRDAQEVAAAYPAFEQYLLLPRPCCPLSFVPLSIPSTSLSRCLLLFVPPYSGALRPA